MIKNIILACIAFVFLLVLAPFGLVVVLYNSIKRPQTMIKRISNLFLRIAISLDQLGNVIVADLFNVAFVKGDYIQFGNEDYTISYVLGRNQERGTLSKLGLFVVFILDKIEKDHCIKTKS